MALDYLVAALAFLAASVAPVPWAADLPPFAAVGAAAGSVVASFLLALAVARLLEARLSSGRDAAALAGLYARAALFFRAAMLALFAAAIHPLGFGKLVRSLPAADWLPGAAEALILAPFVLSLVLSAVAFHRLEGAGAGLLSFLVFRLRGALVLLAVLVAGGALVESLFLEGPVADFLKLHPAVMLAAAAALVTAASVSVPLALRAMWPTAPLPEGPLRDELEEFSAAAGFRFSGVRVWDTGGMEFLNAAVSGVLPRLRYVFLTRALCENLEVKEVLCVFAHEVGHAAGGHAFAFFGLALGWAGFFLSVNNGPLFPGDRLLALVLQALLTVAFGAVFVAFTRRFEVEADLYAAGKLGAAAFSRTLLKVSALNGDSPDRRSLTHASVRSRIRFLEELLSDDRAAGRFRAFNGALRLAAAATAAAGLLLALPALLR